MRGGWLGGSSGLWRGPVHFGRYAAGGSEGPHCCAHSHETCRPSLRKGAAPADLAALEAVYKARTGGPLWMTDMGFSAKGEQALSEISEADDWGLDASAFDLPSGNDLPAGPEAAAIGELKLDLAILKYARFARGGRLTSLDIDDKLDQAPLLRGPNRVLLENGAFPAPARPEPGHLRDCRLRRAGQLPSVASPQARAVRPAAASAAQGPRQGYG